MLTTQCTNYKVYYRPDTMEINHFCATLVFRHMHCRFSVCLIRIVLLKKVIIVCVDDLRSPFSNIKQHDNTHIVFKSAVGY